MVKKGYEILLLFALFPLFVGCGGKITGEMGPFVAVEAGPAAVEVALSLTTEGALKVVGSYTYTLIERKPLKMGWHAAVEYVLKEAKHRKYALYIVYQKPDGEIYQDVYDIGKPFRVTFTESEHVEIIESSSSGSVIVRVKIRPSTVVSPAAGFSQDSDQSSEPARITSPTKEASTSVLPREQAEKSPCANSPKRLSVGGQAKVCTYSSKEPVRIRSGPGVWYSYEHELKPGAVVRVLDGPVCDEDSRWWYWKIETQTKHYVGWMAEGGDDKDPYFLCPYP